MAPSRLPTVAADTPFEQPLIRLLVQTKQGLAHTRDSLGEQPLLVMMLLQLGACYRVIDGISVTGCGLK